MRSSAERHLVKYFFICVGKEYIDRSFGVYVRTSNSLLEEILIL